MQRKDYDAALERLRLAKDAIARYASTFDAYRKAGLYSSSEVGRISAILQDYNLRVAAIEHLRDVVDDWGNRNGYFDIKYDATGKETHVSYEPFKVLDIYFKSFTPWTDPSYTYDPVNYVNMTYYMALEDALNKTVVAIGDLPDAIPPPVPLPAFGGMILGPPTTLPKPNPAPPPLPPGGGGGVAPLPDPFGPRILSIPTPGGLPDPFSQRILQSDTPSPFGGPGDVGGPPGSPAIRLSLDFMGRGTQSVARTIIAAKDHSDHSDEFASSNGGSLLAKLAGRPDSGMFGFAEHGPAPTAPGRGGGGRGVDMFRMAEKFRRGRGGPDLGAGPSVVNVKGPAKAPSGDGANPPASRSTSPSTQGTARDNSGKSTGDLHVDHPDPGSSKSTGKPTETRAETPTVVQGSVDGGTTETTVSAPKKAPVYATETIIENPDTKTVETYTPPADKQIDQPVKKDEDRPNPDDSGGGGGGPRSNNDNPNPEDSGSGGGNPRAAASSRYRPADDDGSGGSRGGGGRGGGPGGPRSYDAYPDPESSGGGNPHSRGEMPNPEDTGSPRGPGARIGNRTFGTSYGSGSGAL